MFQNPNFANGSRARISRKSTLSNIPDLLNIIYPSFMLINHFKQVSIKCQIKYAKNVDVDSEIVIKDVAFDVF